MASRPAGILGELSTTPSPVHETLDQTDDLSGLLSKMTLHGLIVVRFREKLYDNKALQAKAPLPAHEIYK